MEKTNTALNFNPYCRNTNNPMDDDVISSTAFSIEGLKENYLFGLPLTDAKGNEIPIGLYIHHLNAAISWAEGMLGIQISPLNVLEEAQDYRRNDYINWGYIQVFKYPVIEVTRLHLMYGRKPAVKMPLNWLKVDKLTGKIELFPVYGTANALAITSGGLILGMTRWEYAPQQWEIDYKAGFLKVPADLQELIYKKAAISVLEVAGDFIMGLSPGISNMSLSIDGLSQSVGSVNSAQANALGARIASYQNDIKDGLSSLQMRYTGLRMAII